MLAAGSGDVCRMLAGFSIEQSIGVDSAIVEVGGRLDGDGQM